MDEGRISNGLKRVLNKNVGELTKIEGNISSAAGDKEIKTILVTSSNRKEGKSTAAVSIAFGFSYESAKRILLIDGNLRSPVIHKIFNTEREPGLADLCSTNMEYFEVLKATESEYLTLIPCGSRVKNSIDILGSSAFREKLLSLRPWYDYIVFDSPSVLESSDVAIVARYFDGVILVIECEKTRREVVESATEQLNKVDSYILGVVLNKRQYYIPKTLYGKK